MTSQLQAIHGPVRPLVHTSVVEAVQRLASAHPDSPAIVHHGVRWTFGQLWSNASAIADMVTESGVGPDDRVAIWAERTAGSVAAALGVMAAGAAYVPLDPSYPASRTQAILDAADLSLLLFDGTAQTRPPALPGVDSADISGVPAGGTTSPRQAPPGDAAAYVIFTSGSTGAPKGVVVEHGSLINYSSWCASLLGDGGAPLFGSLGFDHSITSLWPPLVRGSAVTLCDGVWDQQSLFGARYAPFALMKVTPSHLRFFERTVKPDYRTITNVLMSGGEMLDTVLLRSVQDRLDGIRLVNHYGPTETTVGCCYFEFDRSTIPDLPSVPIGRPIWNTRAYVVDENLEPARPGQPGELVIAGAGVARGYLGQAPAAGRFLAETDLGGPAGRAYRTGDQVELLPSGALLYLGRNDDQVKLNGYRIELGAVRSLVLALAEVEDAGFEIERGTTDQLRAFVVPRPGVAPEAVSPAVRRALGTVLPPALVPRQVTVVPELALNAHGKRDLKETARRLGTAAPR